MWCQKFLELATSDVAAAAAVGVLWSILVQSFAWFAKLGFSQKRLVMFALSLVLPVGSLLLGALAFKCDGMVVSLDTVVKVLEVACTTFTMTQAAHLVVRKAS